MLLPVDVNSTSMWAGLPRHMYEGDSDVNVPDSIDWRSQGYVTPVKNQGGECGSCYAFSATGAIEGQWYRKTGKLISLSEQQIVECSSKNYQCAGGWPNSSFEYVIAQGGLESESDYPYTGQNGTCKFQASRSVAKIKNFSYVKQTEKGLQIVVGTEGPVSIVIPVSDDFMSYQGDIFVDSTCKTKPIGLHAMLVVGYGSSGGSDYWIVKNSWGTRWGEKGYIRMARNRGNMCYIASGACLPGV